MKITFAIILTFILSMIAIDYYTVTSSTEFKVRETLGMSTDKFNGVGKTIFELQRGFITTINKKESM